jgi:hypothetical protein
MTPPPITARADSSRSGETTNASAAIEAQTKTAVRPTRRNKGSDSTCLFEDPAGGAVNVANAGGNADGEKH